MKWLVELQIEMTSARVENTRAKKRVLQVVALSEEKWFIRATIPPQYFVSEN